MFKPSVLMAAVAVSVSVSSAACHAGWHHRHGCGSCGSQAHHRWHGSNGSWGGSSGGSTGGSSGGSAGGSAAAAPAQKPAAPAAGKASNRVPSTGAMLVLHVPENAAVVINGQRTTLTGAVREFVASDLAEDGRYEYEVTMTVDEGAIRREVTKTVWLAAGTEQALSLGQGSPAAAQQAAAGDASDDSFSPEPPAPGVETTASTL